MSLHKAGHLLSLHGGARRLVGSLPGPLCLIATVLTLGCQTTVEKKLPNPKTIDTSTTAGLIRKLQAINDTPAKTESLRYIGFLIADYGTSTTSQVVNTMLKDPSLTSAQRIWLQEIRIDMGRGLVGCATNPSPAVNIFQELFILKVAYLIAKRDAPEVLKGKEGNLISTLDGLQKLLWGKVKDAVDAPLTPLDNDVDVWMKAYGNDTHRFWWPREVGLLMSLESVDNLQFTGMLASVERANEGIDQLNKTFESTQFLIERLPMLSSWELQLAISKMLDDPAVAGFIDNFKRISTRMAKLEETVGSSFASFSQTLTGFSKMFSSGISELSTGVEGLANTLQESRERLADSLKGLETQIARQNQVLVGQLSTTSKGIGDSSRELATTVSRLNETVVQQEANVEKMAQQLRDEVTATANLVLDRATFRIGLAVGVGVLCALMIAGLVGLVVLRSRLPGKSS